MSAKIINLVLEQGTDFQSTFTIYNENGSKLNLFNYTAISYIKKSPYSSKTYPFTISFPDRTQGKIMVSMAKTETSLMEGGRYVYDVVITDTSSSMIRVIEGMALVSKGVTQ